MDLNSPADQPGFSGPIRPGRPTLLLVDDERINLVIMAEVLRPHYNTVAAQSGEEAWELLDSAPEAFDAVLLDRIMYELSGEDVLRRIRLHPQLDHLPVIFQSVRTAGKDIRQGLELGADYYVTKPYDDQHLLGTVHSAVSRYTHWRKSQRMMCEAQDTLRSLQSVSAGSMCFEFGNLTQAKRLAYLLANTCPDPGRAVVGLIELTLNAVEHGLAGIGYEEKSALLNQGVFFEECERRLRDLPDSRASIQVSVIGDKPIQSIEFVIEDPGAGFDHECYQELDEHRLFDTHGRGIAISRLLAFDELFYNAAGNKVTARVQVTR